MRNCERTCAYLWIIEYESIEVTLVPLTLFHSKHVAAECGRTYALRESLFIRDIKKWAGQSVALHSDFVRAFLSC